MSSIQDSPGYAARSADGPAKGRTLRRLLAPMLRPNRVSRPGLDDRIEAGFAMGRKVTLVSAPAGYGKTTITLEWLSRQERPYAWAALDEGDGDPARFLQLFLSAVRELSPGAEEAAFSLLSSPQIPNAQAIARILAADVAGVNTPLLIVLDDYHLARNPYIHDFIQTLVEGAPPGLHLVLATREDPPLPLARWRVNNLMTEIRTGELRFSPSESRRFFKDTMGLDLDDATVAALGDRTEGWAAGLQLAGLSLQGRDARETSAFIQSFRGSHRFIIDYLVDEVLARLEPDLRRFICETALLDRFTAELCDAVTGRTDSAMLLRELEKANLFMISLDASGEWHRYHRLFADFVITELPHEHKASLHTRAAVWFEKHGDYVSAVRHAFAGGEQSLAEQLIHSASPQLLRRGALQTLMGWLDRIPGEDLGRDGELSLYKAWCLFLTGHSDAIAFLASLDSHPDFKEASPLRGGWLALKALLHMGGDSGSQMAEESVRLTQNAEPLFRLSALLTLGQAHASMGRAASAEASFREAWLEARETDDDFTGHAALANLGINLLWQGKRREAQTICLSAVQCHTDSHGRPLPAAGMTLLPLGMALYEANELEAACGYLQKGVELCRQQMLAHVAGIGEWVLALALEIGERRSEADRIVQDTRQLGIETRQPGIVSLMEALEAELAIRRGDVAWAARWLELSEGEVPPPEKRMVSSSYYRSPSVFMHGMTMMRVLLHAGRPARALDFLGIMQSAAEEDQRYGHLIRIHLLQSAAHLELRNEGKAVNHLEAALRHAAPEGFIRAFLDAGARVQGLLPAVRTTAPAFVDRVTHEICSSPAQKPALTGMLENLGERELEILRLVAQGLSNQELAGRLYITEGTAKWHLSNILAKLGARNRTQAVEFARRSGLI